MKYLFFVRSKIKNLQIFHLKYFPLNVLSRMDANLKFKAERVLFRCTYTSDIFAIAWIQIDWFNFISLTVGSQNRCQFEILINRFWSAELACFWCRQAGEQCCWRRQSWNVKRATVSPGFWVVSLHELQRKFIVGKFRKRDYYLVKHSVGDHSKPNSSSF